MFLFMAVSSNYPFDQQENYVRGIKFREIYLHFSRLDFADAKILLGVSKHSARGPTILVRPSHKINVFIS